jgi:hypothetical protein
MFATYYPNGNITFQNLVINGCNQAVGVTSNVVRFWNTYLSASGGGANGSALYLQDTFWIYFDYGGLTTSSTSVPTLLMSGYPCSGCYAGVGNVYMTNSLLAGGPISYIQLGNISGEPSGHWVFRNITQESGNGDLIQITDPGGYATGAMGPITLDDVQQADNMSSSAALINFNVSASGAGLSGVYINNSFSGVGAANAPAIKMTAGTLDHYFVTSCDSGCVSQVWNSSGNPAGSGMIESGGGLDFTDDVTNAGRLNTSPFSAQNINGYGPGARFVQSGSSFASYGIDAANGWMFGSNTLAGWNAQISQSTAPNIDIAFAANYPPTGVGGFEYQQLLRDQRRDVRSIEYFRTADGGRGSDHGRIQSDVDGGVNGRERHSGLLRLREQREAVQLRVAIDGALFRRRHGQRDDDRHEPLTGNLSHHLSNGAAAPHHANGRDVQRKLHARRGQRGFSLCACLHGGHNLRGIHAAEPGRRGFLRARQFLDARGQLGQQHPEYGNQRKRRSRRVQRFCGVVLGGAELQRGPMVARND